MSIKMNIGGKTVRKLALILCSLGLLLSFLLGQGFKGVFAINLGLAQFQIQVALANPIIPLLQMWQAFHPTQPLENPEEESKFHRGDESPFPYDDKRTNKERV